MQMSTRERTVRSRDKLRKFTHEERVEIAQRISSLLLDKYKDSVLAVFIYASTAKKLDRPYSDLEIAAVMRDGIDIPTKSYLYKGLLIETYYPQESNLLKEARKVGQNWPIEADQYRNRKVLFERDGWARRLEEAVEESEKADFSTALHHSTMAVLESLASLRNAALTGNSLDAKTRGFWFAYDAARLLLLLNRRYVITTSWFWKQTFECSDKPRDFESLVRTIAGFDRHESVETTSQAAEQLWDELLDMVESRGVNVESSQLIV